MLADRNLVGSLGFNMKERPGSREPCRPRASPKVVANDASSKCRTLQAGAHSFPNDYEHILRVLENMVRVMERSPSAFASMDEEALRSHFLVQLNGHYEGQATGETFNYEGKTDILVRSEGKNVFIAECKFWSGPKKLVETINQLLGYSSWQDTKVAVIVFNRKRDFSKVLAAIPETVKSHPNFKRELPGSSETTFRYRFAHRDDRNREMILTVLAFDVPRERVMTRNPSSERTATDKPVPAAHVAARRSPSILLYSSGFRATIPERLSLTPNSHVHFIRPRWSGS